MFFVELTSFHTFEAVEKHLEGGHILLPILGFRNILQLLKIVQKVTHDLIICANQVRNVQDIKVFKKTPKTI